MKRKNKKRSEAKAYSMYNSKSLSIAVSDISMPCA